MRILSTVLLSTVVSLGACGSDAGDRDEPLISGSLAGEYKGQAFTPDTGFATVYVGSPLIGVGDGGLNCDSPDRDDPPPGSSAAFVVPAFEAGTYADVLVHLYRNVDDFEGRSSSGGLVTITTATAASVAGTIDYMDTDTDGLTYRLVGSFEVVRCPM